MDCGGRGEEVNLEEAESRMWTRGERAPSLFLSLSLYIYIYIYTCI